MDYKKVYEEWLNNNYIDEEVKAELISIKDVQADDGTFPTLYGETFLAYIFCMQIAFQCFGSRKLF